MKIIRRKCKYLQEDPYYLDLVARHKNGRISMSFYGGGGSGLLEIQDNYKNVRFYDEGLFKDKEMFLDEEIKRLKNELSLLEFAKSEFFKYDENFLEEKRKA